MKGAVAQLRPVTGDDRLVVRNKARETLEEEVSRLKQTTKEAQSATRLLTALKAAMADPKNADVLEQAKKVVGGRIQRLKTVESAFDRSQNRDLEIIIHFTSGGIGLDDLRTSACALMQLNGSADSVKEICQIYPGLRKMFD